MNELYRIGYERMNDQIGYEFWLKCRFLLLAKEVYLISSRSKNDMLL